jgi:hypothetical protein
MLRSSLNTPRLFEIANNRQGHETMGQKRCLAFCFSALFPILFKVNHSLRLSPTLCEVSLCRVAVPRLIADS